VWLGDLIFGLVRLRSSAFGFMRQCKVADVYGIQRTVILTPENRKVDCSSLFLAIQLSCLTSRVRLGALVCE
jgi:hypothetical protein